MLHSFDKELGIFYMHYHIDMIRHGPSFGEPVGGTGGSKLVTHSQQMNCQSRKEVGQTINLLTSTSAEPLHCLQDRSNQGDVYFTDLNLIKAFQLH